MKVAPGLAARTRENDWAKTRLLFKPAPEGWRFLKGNQPMPKELQPRKAAPTWDSLSPGEKQAWLLDQALDFKRDILTTH
jgi:hypothetical protein